MNCRIVQSGDWDVCAKEQQMKVVHEYRAGRSIVRYERRPVAAVLGISSDTLTSPPLE